jgi:hypothetical protein
MSFSEGHQQATFTGLITFPNVQADFTIEALDPSTPGNFAKNSSGNIQWILSGNLTREGSTGPFTGTLWAIGTTDGGTIFKFPLAASYLDGQLTLTSTGPVGGDYNSTPTWGFDFTSPGSSNKVTQGDATISWSLGPIPSPPPPALPGTQSVNLVFDNGRYNMKFEQGHHDAIFTGSLKLNNTQVNFTVMADDPTSPGNFVKDSSGKITWQVSGVLYLSQDGKSYSGTLIATGTTAGGTVFTFPLKATYQNGTLTFDPISQVTGTYTLDTTKAVTYDFTSPGDSHKITQGLATISLTSSDTAAATATSTTTASPTSMQTSTALISTTAPAISTSVPLTATGPTVTPTSLTSIVPAAAVSSAITSLPPPATFTAAGPPGQAVSAAAPGQAGGAAVVGPTAVVTPSGVAPPGLQAASPPALSTVALTSVPPPVLTPSGIAPPGLQNRADVLSGPPGHSKAPGQGGDPPGNAYGRNK